MQLCPTNSDSSASFTNATFLGEPFHTNSSGWDLNRKPSCSDPSHCPASIDALERDFRETRAENKATHKKATHFFAAKHNSSRGEENLTPFSNGYFMVLDVYICDRVSNNAWLSCALNLNNAYCFCAEP